MLEARAQRMAAVGSRLWIPSPNEPALIVVIEEYAELADESPAAIARRGRTVAVTLLAAAQRATLDSLRTIRAVVGRRSTALGCQSREPVDVTTAWQLASSHVLQERAPRSGSRAGWAARWTSSTVSAMAATPAVQQVVWTSVSASM
jgi:hypothetical protein